MRKPYIGVTGITSLREAQALLAGVPPSSERLLMVGVLASAKTLRGDTTKYPQRYPQVEEIAGIFSDDARALNLIHFATDTQETLGDQLRALVHLGGPRLHGFQLNVVWPSRDVLRVFHDEFPDKHIVLQIGKRAAEQEGDDPQRVAERVATYEGLADYLLLDSSGGLGKELDAERSRAYLNAFTERKVNIGLGVAGGMSAETYHLVAPLLKEFPGLSIDAEGRLRNENDELQLERAKEYLAAAFAGYREGDMDVSIDRRSKL